MALAHLGIDAALDGPAIYGDIFLLVIQPVAFGHPDHLLHQVQPSNTLSYWMFHLSEEAGRLISVLQGPTAINRHHINPTYIGYRFVTRCLWLSS